MLRSKQSDVLCLWFWKEGRLGAPDGGHTAHVPEDDPDDGGGAVPVPLLVPPAAASVPCRCSEGEGRDPPEGSQPGG